jgi:diaminohydroxyphosphoribosylaminopyrimidine deaminase/5-amino-6-(5-phosphoribosylamino)uracil reductase
MDGLSVKARNIHERYMRMAVSLAWRGTGRVSPNPRVGCVIVDFSSPEGRVVSRDYHKKYGGPHAEAEALAAARESVAGMTAYVTLEPCCHTGHTPPCCDALVASGISRVVVGMSDPDPRVSGGGVSRLEAAGVTVIGPVLEDECAMINRGFVKRVTSGRPWVTVKAAMSLDGDVALAGGESKWITGSPARRLGHLMRAECDAVIVGSGTVLADDPALSVRDTDGRSPMKVIVDKNLDIPTNARATGGGCTIFAAEGADESKAAELERGGAKIIKFPLDGGGKIPPGEMLRALAGMGINYVMVEGGAGIISSFISSGEADEVVFFEAPKLMGAGIGVTSRMRVTSMDRAAAVKNIEIKRVGADFMIKGVASCSRVW